MAKRTRKVTASSELTRQVAINSTNIAHLQQNVEEIHDDVKTLLATMERVKGGWRMALVLAGTAGAAGAAVAKIMPFLKS